MTTARPATAGTLTGDLVDGFRLAVSLLTVVPAGRLPGTTRGAARAAMVAAPLAALPLGIAVAAVGLVGGVVDLPPLVTALLVTATLALGTRAMHLDGLADTVDGLGGGWDRDRALEIMHRGDVGPMGAAALILTLGLQSTAAAAVLTRPDGWLVVAAAVVVSRTACALACARGVSAARRSGLGVAVAGSVPRLVSAVVLLAGLALLALACVASGLPGLQGALATGVAVIGVALLVRRCVRVLGGVTGDVMGASIEVFLTILLVVLAAG